MLGRSGGAVRARSSAFARPRCWRSRSRHGRVTRLVLDGLYVCGEMGRGRYIRSGGPRGPGADSWSSVRTPSSSLKPCFLGQLRSASAGMCAASNVSAAPSNRPGTSRRHPRRARSGGSTVASPANRSSRASVGQCPSCAAGCQHRISPGPSLSSDRVRLWARTGCTAGDHRRRHADGPSGPAGSSRGLVGPPPEIRIRTADMVTHTGAGRRLIVERGVGGPSARRTGRRSGSDRHAPRPVRGRPDGSGLAETVVQPGSVRRRLGAAGCFRGYQQTLGCRHSGAERRTARRHGPVGVVYRHN